MPYKDREVRRQKDGEYYQQHKEKMGKQQQEYREEHREKLRALAREYYQHNRERIQKYNALYYQGNRELILRRSRDSFERWKRGVKEIVLYHYGGDKLACIRCGFSDDIRALTIDHINDDGAKERALLGQWSSLKLYSQLLDKGFPEGYQTLCMNCQMIKELERRARLKKGVGKDV